MNSILTWAIGLFIVLTFAGLSALMSEKAGVVNVAVEGFMTIGALVVAILGTIFNNADTEAGNLSQIWVLVIAALVTGIFSLLHAFPSITLKSNQIVSGTAINVLALGIGLFFCNSGMFGEQSLVIVSKYKPFFLTGNNIISVWIIPTILFITLVMIFFKFTKQGMRYKMVGENPNAIDAAGISVYKYRYIAVFISGVIGGLGGGLFILTPVGNGIFSGTMFGYGFLGVAIMIFGQWKVIFMTIAAFFFSILFAFGQQIANSGLLPEVEDVSDIVRILRSIAGLYKALPFFITIFAMIIFSKSSRAPEAIGKPFNKERR